MILSRTVVALRSIEILYLFLCIVTSCDVRVEMKNSGLTTLDEVAFKPILNALMTTPGCEGKIDVSGTEKLTFHDLQPLCHFILFLFSVFTEQKWEFYLRNSYISYTRMKSYKCSFSNEGSPIKCTCNMAWLLTADASLKTRVIGTCEDGVEFSSQSSEFWTNGCSPASYWTLTCTSHVSSIQRWPLPPDLNFTFNCWPMSCSFEVFHVPLILK